MKTNPLHFAIAQMNPCVGDFEGNARKIISWIQAAEKKGAELIVFPECALSGYPVWDLANKRAFVEESLRQLDRIAQSTRRKKITAALGYIDFSKDVAGRSSNSLAWITGGKVTAKRQKRLLPTYDVFLEDIFFAPGEKSEIIRWKQRRIGPTICEDLWDSRYEIKPVKDLAKQGADLILNISASPYYYGVPEVRENLVRRHVRESGLPLLYVNQVGAQDDLIFDGRSFFMDSKGNVIFRAPAFTEDVFYFDWDGGPQSWALPPAGSGRAGEVYQALVLGVRDYCQKNRFSRVVIGLSGGIDSALVAAIAVDALGPQAVLGISMPGPYSSKGSWQDAEELAENLGIELRSRPIKAAYQLMTRKSQGLTLAMENLQARLRGLELMFVSNSESRLLLTTGNKSELAMGYCTLYGDMNGGLSVIGDVYKTDVYRLAAYRNEQSQVIPRATIEKAPSAELRPNQKDEDSLPPYAVLDRILYYYIEKNKDAVQIVRELQKEHLRVSMKLVLRCVQSVDHNEYKRRQTPPILRVTEKAWFGRRMPVTNRFAH
jgi:NAD+ synthase (glutamine-hydrolysing)